MPGAAQNVVGAGVKFATQSDVALKVAQKVGQQTARASCLPAQYIKIANLPGKPLMPLYLGEQTCLASALQSNVPLDAKLLDPRTIDKFFSSRNKGPVYVPAPWVNQQEPSWYRGIWLYDLTALKNVLVNGMEVSRSHYREIFVISRMDLALQYALPPTVWAGPILPVVVRIPMVPELLEQSKSDLCFEKGLVDMFYRDIPASFIADVMVFLEVDGKPGWYKVILQKDELTFRPVVGVNLSLKGVKK